MSDLPKPPEKPPGGGVGAWFKKFLASGKPKPGADGGGTDHAQHAPAGQSSFLRNFQVKEAGRAREENPVPTAPGPDTQTPAAVVSAAPAAAPAKPVAPLPAQPPSTGSTTSIFIPPVSVILRPDGGEGGQEKDAPPAAKAARGEADIAAVKTPPAAEKSIPRKTATFFVQPEPFTAKPQPAATAKPLSKETGQNTPAPQAAQARPAGVAPRVVTPPPTALPQKPRTAPIRIDPLPVVVKEGAPQLQAEKKAAPPPIPTVKTPAAPVSGTGIPLHGIKPATLLSSPKPLSADHPHKTTTIFVKPVSMVVRPTTGRVPLVPPAPQEAPPAFKPPPASTLPPQAKPPPLSTGYTSWIAVKPVPTASQPPDAAGKPSPPSIFPHAKPDSTLLRTRPADPAKPAGGVLLIPPPPPLPPRVPMAEETPPRMVTPPGSTVAKPVSTGLPALESPGLGTSSSAGGAPPLSTARTRFLAKYSSHRKPAPALFVAQELPLLTPPPAAPTAAIPAKQPPPVADAASVAAKPKPEAMVKPPAEKPPPPVPVPPRPAAGPVPAISAIPVKPDETPKVVPQEKKPPEAKAPAPAPTVAPKAEPVPAKTPPAVAPLKAAPAPVPPQVPSAPVPAKAIPVPAKEAPKQTAKASPVPEPQAKGQPASKAVPAVKDSRKQKSKVKFPEPAPTEAKKAPEAPAQRTRFPRGIAWTAALLLLLGGLGVFLYYQFRETRLDIRIVAGDRAVNSQVYVVRNFTGSLETVRHNYRQRRAPLEEEAAALQASHSSAKADLAGRQERRRLLIDGMTKIREDIPRYIAESQAKLKSLWETDGAALDQEFADFKKSLLDEIEGRAAQIGIAYTPNTEIDAVAVACNAFRLALYGAGKRTNADEQRAWIEELQQRWDKFETEWRAKQDGLRDRALAIKREPGPQIESAQQRLEAMQVEVEALAYDIDAIGRECERYERELAAARQRLGEVLPPFLEEARALPEQFRVGMYTLDDKQSLTLRNLQDDPEFQADSLLVLVRSVDGGQEFWAYKTIKLLEYEKNELTVDSSEFRPLQGLVTGENPL